VVYDVGSRAAVAHFAEAPGNYGWVAAVAPTGDAVAVGGYMSKVVTLRELAPPPPLHRRAMGGAGAGDALAGAATVGDVVALAADNHLEVHSRSGAWLPLALELGAAIGCSGGFNNPVAVRPGGEHVACALSQGKVVVCRALPSGAEAFALDRSHLDGGAFGLCWSPGGYLLVYGAFGTAVFDAAGAKLKVLSDEGQSVQGLAFSADGARLATASTGNKLFVRDTKTWQVSHVVQASSAGGTTINSPCFDLAGECVAAHTVDGACGNRGSVVVHRLDGSATAQHFPGVNAAGSLKFSADGRFLFAGGGDHYRGYDRMVMLSRTTGAEADWSAALAAMALPPGTLSGHTLAVPTTSASGFEGTLHLQIAAGSVFVEIDGGLARRAIDDNAWGYAQLVQLAAMAESSDVGDLMERAPHCLNICDAATGDTLLHHSASTGNMTIAEACLASAAAVFIPIANAEGKTALHVALERREQQLTLMLAKNLTPHLTDVTATLLTDALQTAALTMPEVVLSLMHHLEGTVLVEQATMHTLHHRTHG
jgi:hypothetical protein